MIGFSELDWVRFLKKKAKKNKSILAGIGEDCAVIKEKNKYYLISSDLFIEDVHFRLKEISFLNIGKRATARAISDITACGGEPKFIIVSAGIPSYITPDSIKKIINGIENIASLCGALVIGGDTSKAKKLFLDIWVMGQTKKPILRSTARIGDYIFVTAKLGKLAFNKPFIPPLKEVRYLVKNFKVNAMIDISDGFIIDLYRILKESRKGAILYKDRVPVTCNIKDMYRGEDYGLIFTVDRNEKKIELLKKKFYFVGVVKSIKEGYYFKDKKKKEKINIRGYMHF